MEDVFDAGFDQVSSRRSKGIGGDDDGGSVFGSTRGESAQLLSEGGIVGWRFGSFEGGECEVAEERKGARKLGELVKVHLRQSRISSRTIPKRESGHTTRSLKAQSSKPTGKPSKAFPDPVDRSGSHIGQLRSAIFFCSFSRAVSTSHDGDTKAPKDTAEKGEHRGPRKRVRGRSAFRRGRSV